MFNQRKNKRFSYKPRFQDSKSQTQQEELQENLKKKWDKMRGNTKRRGNILTSFPALIIILALIFVLIYILNGYIK